MLVFAIKQSESATCVYIYICLLLLPHWVEFLVMYTRFSLVNFSLVIYFVHSRRGSPNPIHPTSPSPLGVHSLWVQVNLLVYFWMTIGGRGVEFDVSIETERRCIVSLYIYFVGILFLEERLFITQTQWLFLNGSAWNMLLFFFLSWYTKWVLSESKVTSSVIFLCVTQMCSKLSVHT